MTTLTHLDAKPHQATSAIRDGGSSREGLDSTVMKREHRVGNTVDKVDQVSSVTLLGFTVAGSAVMLVAHWLVG
ncbi:hypothetical protein [Methylobacterium sp. 37f]|uniref:hypothetical protein n=1 Tax=Methylobacterium sp. 37f TaxID=2817058 RepID=UPI001FFD91FB|nr:hypothetical protein [Methylobacterium sp. 37f]MCK2053746.1 hypothetical protein [Methylobacterium sp. 37f]